LESLKKNSIYDHEYCIHLNEADEASVAIAAEYTDKISISDKNLGLPGGANKSIAMATKEWSLLIDDDMIALRAWDQYLVEFKEANNLPHKSTIASTCIEPDGDRPATIKENYGRTPAEVTPARLEQLEQDVEKLRGSTVPRIFIETPMLIATKYLIQIGGYSPEYLAGIGTEIDLAKKLWDIGFRNFVNVPNSIVYHIQSQSTRHLRATNESYKRHSDNRTTSFTSLYGIDPDDFRLNTLKKEEAWTLQE
jgi:GT2 family glycosyltransferase